MSHFTTASVVCKPVVSSNLLQSKYPFTKEIIRLVPAPGNREGEKWATLPIKLGWHPLDIALDLRSKSKSSIGVAVFYPPSKQHVQNIAYCTNNRQRECTALSHYFAARTLVDTLPSSLQHQIQHLSRLRPQLRSFEPCQNPH